MKIQVYLKKVKSSQLSEKPAKDITLSLFRIQLLTFFQHLSKTQSYKFYIHYKYIHYVKWFAPYGVLFSCPCCAFLLPHIPYIKGKIFSVSSLKSILWLEQAWWFCNFLSLKKKKSMLASQTARKRTLFWKMHSFPAALSVTSNGISSFLIPLRFTISYTEWKCGKHVVRLG